MFQEVVIGKKVVTLPLGSVFGESDRGTLSPPKRMGGKFSGRSILRVQCLEDVELAESVWKEYDTVSLMCGRLQTRIYIRALQCQLLRP